MIFREKSMKNLYVIRGPFGTGKTEFARTITDNVVSSWDYYMQYGENSWNEKLKPYADKYCISKTEELMKKGTKSVAVTSSFSTNSDIDVYYKLAEQYGYKVFCLVMDNRDISEYKKDVPREVVADQAERLRRNIGLGFNGYYNFISGQSVK